MDIQERAWRIEQFGFSPVHELSLEPLFSIGNGVLGIRGSVDFPLPSSQPDLFIGGIYGDKAQHLPYSEMELISVSRPIAKGAEIVPFPSPFPFLLRVEGVALTMASPHLRRFLRTLDLRNPRLVIEYEYRLADRIVSVKTTRLASIATPNNLLQEIEITTNRACSASIDFFNEAHQVSQDYPHLLGLSRLDKSVTPGLQEYQIVGSDVRCCIASNVIINDHPATAESLALTLNPEIPLRIRRTFSIYTDLHSPHPRDAAIAAIQTVSAKWLTEGHTKKWRGRWARSDIDFEGRPELTQAYRFNAYQLQISATDSRPMSPGARGLTGRAYEGHVFWDSEVFMFPYFLYTAPDIARSMLEYRYQTLPGAKSRASALGYQGACFAWESTITGEDVTPTSLTIKDTGQTIPIFTGTQQIHVTADVAHAVWQFWEATRDYGFLETIGAEIFVETARFWASRAQSNSDGFNILGVIGPDEYHFNIDNNAFTIWMAKLNLLYATRVVRLLQRRNSDDFHELQDRLSVSEFEVSHWERVAMHLRKPVTDQSGVIEQFDGFFTLPRAPFVARAAMRAPIHRLLDWKSTNQTRVIKQADVLMIPFLFPDALTAEQVRANYSYYEPLTDHGSSLSPCVHAAVAMRAGLIDEGLRYFETSTFFDFLDQMANTALGIHTGSIGGAWQTLVFHMAGVRFDNGNVVANSFDKLILPRGVSRLKLNLFYRGKRHTIALEPKKRTAA